jgi:hypothetical protein
LTAPAVALGGADHQLDGALMEGIDTALAGDASVERVSYWYPDGDGRLSERATVVCRRDGKERRTTSFGSDCSIVAEEVHLVP